jgi:Tfp pilus assembly protein PilN
VNIAIDTFKNMKPAKDYINLLPQREKGPAIVTNRGYLIAILFIMIWVGLFGWQAKQQWDLKRRLAPLGVQQQALQQQADAMRKELGITSPGATSPEKAALIQTLLEERVLWSEVFKQFSFLVPKGLWFDSLEGNTAGNTAELRLRGGAYSYRTIAEFMLSMEKSGYFNNPRLSFARNTVVQGQEIVNFEVTSGILKKQEAR